MQSPKTDCKSVGSGQQSISISTIGILSQLTHIKNVDQHAHTNILPILCLVLYLDNLLGRVAQSVTCLATDACLTADPGVASSIQVQSHTFVEIDHEKISTVILLPSADLFKKGCCELQAKVCTRITG